MFFFFDGLLFQFCSERPRGPLFTLKKPDAGETALHVSCGTIGTTPKREQKEEKSIKISGKLVDISITTEHCVTTFINLNQESEYLDRYNKKFD